MLSKEVSKDIKNASAIRKMFEEGIELKKKYGFENVADFSLGNPLIEPPQSFNDALYSVATQGKTGTHQYMANVGYIETREAVASDLKNKGYMKDVTPNNVVMTVGAAGGLNTVLKAILNKGDRVVTPSPYFPEYRFYAKNHGGKHVIVDTDKDFNLDVKKINKALTKRTKALIITSPNNPTGVVYSKEKLGIHDEVIKKKEKKFGNPIYLISDEPYRELVYDGDFVSPASLHDNSFMVYSWSKSLSIPGERIGYIATNPKMDFLNDIMGGLAFCNRTLGYINAPALMQNILPEVIDEKVDVDYYKGMRDNLVDCLNDNNYRFASPDGAFYFWVECPGFEVDAKKREEKFISKAKENLLLVGPGSTFGTPGWFRISYSVNPDVIKLGCEKLEDMAKLFKIK